MNNVPSARQMKIRGCALCGLACEIKRLNDHSVRCPRCHTLLHDGNGKNLRLSWALLVAAIILYIPANLLPVMYTSLLGRGSESTIISGVLEFWHNGAYDIAVVIFIASVVIPCIKFLSMGLLLITAGRNSRWAKRERTRLYCIIEWIGCWSMLDVVVVAVVCGLVRFNALSEAEPRAGILFFALVVILTMLSALSFNPKLIWEGNE